MNKYLKRFVVIINIVMLLLAIYWYLEKKEVEPVIVTLGQIIAIITLIFEKQFSQIITKRISGSNIKIDTEPGSKILTSKVKDSEIDIKNR
jgi:hypothetical protein